MSLGRLTPLIALALAGCAALKSAEQPITLRLAPAAPAPAASLIAGTLGVVPVQSRGVAGALRYAYSEAATPSVIRQAATLFWEEPPPRTLEHALIAGLRTRFATVNGPELGGVASRRVVVVLTRFEESSAGNGARANVAFEVTMTGPVQISGSYCGSAPINDASTTTRAHAFERAIAWNVDRFTQDAATGVLSNCRTSLPPKSS